VVKVVHKGFVVHLYDVVVEVCSLISMSTANIRKKKNMIGESTLRKIDVLLRRESNMFS